MSIPYIDVANLPSRDDPATFALRADAAWAQLSATSAGINAAITTVEAAANFAAAAVSAPVWTAGSYVTGAARRSEIDAMVYVRLPPGGATTVDPKLDPTNWRMGAMQLPPAIITAATSYTLAAYTHIEFSNAAQCTAVFPPTPAPDDWVIFGFQNSRFDNVVDGNGSKIMGETGPFYAWRRLGGLWRYISTDFGWRLIK